MVQWINDMAFLYGVAGLIPVLVQWVKEMPLPHLQMWLEFDPCLRTSLCRGCHQKEKRKKKKKNKKNTRTRTLKNMVVLNFRKALVAGVFPVAPIPPTMVCWLHMACLWPPSSWICVECSHLSTPGELRASSSCGAVGT